MTHDSPKTFCGTFAIIGLPNAGKSTLLNALVEFKLAPVHAKPQMTRKNLLGLLTRDDTQMIFIDTPGYHTRQDTFSKHMLADIGHAVDEADAVIFLWGKDQTDFDFLRDGLKKFYGKQPLLLVLNKNDSEGPGFTNARQIASELGVEVFEISAKTLAGLPELLQRLKSFCKEHPFFYPADDVSSASHREIAVNILLESMMEVLEQELPYQSAVLIETYETRPDCHHIRATIVVNRDSQKGMVIGKGGRTLKAIGQRARLIMEKTFDAKVFLQLFVKVEHNWIKNEKMIQEFS